MPLCIAARNWTGGRPASSLSRLPAALSTDLSPPPRRLRRAGCLLASCLALMLTAAGCGSQPTVALPRKDTAVTAPGTLDSPHLTARQQVIAAYTGYWQAYSSALSARNAARAKVILAPYDAPAAITRVIAGDQRVWAANETAYGTAEPHILSVHITGSRAQIHDCLDLSHFGALDTRTGRIVPDSFGLPRLNFYITLALSRGRWLVTDMQPVVVPCEP
jgi:hypothetical protein